MTSQHPRLRILILGGTAEARALGIAIAAEPRFEAMVSLAGRTSTPLENALPMRVGGFGGVQGLVSFLREGDFDVLIDATHPFAKKMRHNAAKAASTANIPLLRLSRPAWQKSPGDHWIECEHAAEAAQRLGDGAERTFLAMGRLEMKPFFHLKRPALIRTVDPLDYPPSGWTAITGTGPFVVDDEIELFKANDIQSIVAKNAGGVASVAKIIAARQLGLPIYMISRPKDPEALETKPDVAGVLQWLDHQSRPTDRAV